MRWRRIQVNALASQESLKNANEAAAKHPIGALKKLPFTEANPEWVLLYEHAQIGQITPSTMRYMKRRDLYFLAGMVFPHPALTQSLDTNAKGLARNMFIANGWDRITKLQANVARAKIELDRRNFIWASFFTVLAALAGGVIGSDLIRQLLESLIQGK